MMALEDLYRQARVHDREIRALKARLDAGRSTSQGGSGVGGSPLGVTVWENQSGATRSQGFVGVWLGDRTFTTTVTVGDVDVIGVLDDDLILVGSNGRVRHIGYQRVVDVVGAVTVGHYLQTSATAGAAQDAGDTTFQRDGAFGIALTAAAGPGAGTVAAYLIGGGLPSALTARGYIPFGSEAVTQVAFVPA